LRKKVPLLNRPQEGQTTALYTEQECTYRGLFESFVREQGLDGVSSFHEFWSLEAIKQCVMCGLGIALVPKITVTQELEQHR
jgi:DNA-binding transcriptional LysR family regulator